MVLDLSSMTIDESKFYIVARGGKKNYFFLSTT